MPANNNGGATAGGKLPELPNGAIFERKRELQERLKQFDDPDAIKQPGMDLVFKRLWHDIENYNNDPRVPDHQRIKYPPHLRQWLPTKKEASTNFFQNASWEWAFGVAVASYVAYLGYKRFK